MAHSAQPLVLTVADYLATPHTDTGVRYQLVEGELHRMAAPSRYHQDIVGNVFALLRAYVSEHRLGKVYVSPIDVFLDDINVFQPDVLFISNDRLDKLSDRGIESGPDLIVEVLSPSSRQFDMIAKRQVYARHSVFEYWIIDPDAQTVTIHQNAKTGKPSTTLGPRDSFTSVAITGLTIDISVIFEG